MNLTDFKESLATDHPPVALSAYTQALWYDAKGDWKKAHELVQDLNDKNASWIHAYLHRKEGDLSNADYWYYKAARKRPLLSIGEEWEQIAGSLL